MSKPSRLNQSIPRFVLKLIEILDNPECQNLIAWSGNNESFSILDPLEFTIKILPHYFKHQNFSSFVRQLNMYGFVKLKSDEGQNVYHHPNFKKGHKSGLKKIERRSVAHQEESDINKETNGKKGEKELQIQGFEAIKVIKEQQLQLQIKFNQAIVESRKVFTQNQKIIKNLGSKPEDIIIDHFLQTYQVFADRLQKLPSENSSQKVSTSSRRKIRPKNSQQFFEINQFQEFEGI